MGYEDFIEGLNRELIPDRHYAQILIEVLSSANVEEVKKIIEVSGVSIVEVNLLSPHAVLFKLDTKEIKDVVLKLVGQGFYNLKGMNALP